VAAFLEHSSNGSGGERRSGRNRAGCEEKG